MYWFWFFLFSSQPAFLLLGLLGILGKEAKRAAEDLSMAWGVILLALVVLGVIYLILRSIGVF